MGLHGAKIGRGVVVVASREWEEQCRFVIEREREREREREK